MDYLKIGKISHYFDKIKVAVLDVTDESIKIGDTIRIGEFGVGFEQKVDSMQVEHQQVDIAKKGDEVGLKVTTDIKPGSIVYKINE